MARAAFRWENYKAAAHALGGLDGYTYLNAKESEFAKQNEKKIISKISVSPKRKTV